MADRLGTDPLFDETLIYRGRARLQLGDPDGPDELRRGPGAGPAAGDHECVMFGYHNHVGLLWR